MNLEDRIDLLFCRLFVFLDIRNIFFVFIDCMGNNILMEIFIRVIVRCVLSGFFCFLIVCIILFDLNKDILVVYKDIIV